MYRNVRKNMKNVYEMGKLFCDFLNKILYISNNVVIIDVNNIYNILFETITKDWFGSSTIQLNIHRYLMLFFPFAHVLCFDHLHKIS